MNGHDSSHRTAEQTTSEIRRRQILEHARGKGRVGVNQLASMLHVAAETVRRDLKALEDHGLLRRTHGGALPVDTAGFETKMDQRVALAGPEQGRIAHAAVQLLGPTESVYIDEGSTALAVAEKLLDVDSALTVVTASVPAAVALSARPRTDVLLLGGVLRGQSMATVGAMATSMLSGFNIDLAFLGASGISLDHGLTTAEPGPSELKRVAIAHSRQRVFVGASSKFGTSSFCRYAEVKDFHVLVTDTGLNSHLLTRYKAAGVRLIRA